ncbi:unnamed protein product [Pieris macdunnoughi]|uniref:Uncharacterized protein n=1 Tax=Pieris macdunnoughi TaxID=345717 RepID=A0A821T896_9NEOP|nr:unnamed protein product [Pieris macdunnoughi]
MALHIAISRVGFPFASLQRLMNALELRITPKQNLYHLELDDESNGIPEMEEGKGDQIKRREDDMSEGWRRSPRERDEWKRQGEAYVGRHPDQLPTDK